MAESSRSPDQEVPGDPRVVALRRASLAERWWFALKPASWSKLLVPTVVGQLFGASVSGRFDPAGALFGLGFTVCDLVFIVCLNDWADRDVDALKRQMFPQDCSPKTIPDGVLPARQLLWVGLGAGLLALAVGCLGAVSLGRPSLSGLALLSLGLFVIYSLPPLHLNYRGGGELMEALGVGLVLPALQAITQAGPRVWALLPVFAGLVPLALASALASGLSDEQSDRAGAKRTVASLWGNVLTRRAAELSALVGLSAWVVLSPVQDVYAPVAVVVAVVVGLGHYVRARRVSDSAVTNAFPEQRVFKLHLHRLIAQSSLALAVLTVLSQAIAT